MLAAAVVLLWIPPLGGFRVGVLIEMAFYYGALLLPLAGALLALAHTLSGPLCVGPIVALAVHLLLFLAYLLLAGVPVS